eukprot:10180078-Alexandrium_andersonii.AAC.1
MPHARRPARKTPIILPRWREPPGTPAAPTAASRPCVSEWPTAGPGHDSPPKQRWRPERPWWRAEETEP